MNQPLIAQNVKRSSATMKWHDETVREDVKESIPGIFDSFPVNLQEAFSLVQIMPDETSDSLCGILHDVKR